MTNSKYIIFGASGGIGRHTAYTAKAQGNEVVAVIRKPEQAKDFEDKGITTVLFDIAAEKPAAYTDLLKSTKPDVVVWAAGLAEEGSQPRVVEYDVQVSVYDAMAQAGVRRVLVLSSVGIFKEGSGPPDWLNEKDREAVAEFRGWVPKICEAKVEAETHLRAMKDIDWTIIRPSYLDNSPSRGVEIGKVSYTTGLTSREDVAKVIVAGASVQGLFGRTIDMISGNGTVKDEIEKVVREDIDTWVGPG